MSTRWLLLLLLLLTCQSHCIQLLIKLMHMCLPVFQVLLGIRQMPLNCVWAVHG
jgi:hypothetical protein